jgi:hypothetical protein
MITSLEDLKKQLSKIDNALNTIPEKDNDDKKRNNAIDRTQFKLNHKKKSLLNKISNYEKDTVLEKMVTSIKEFKQLKGSN